MIFSAGETGVFAVWSAGASRFSWTRKRALTKRFVLWLQ